MLFMLLGLPSCAVATVSSGLVASAEDGWPQWRGPRRDGIADETGLLAEWPANGPERLWQAHGLGRGYSSPIVTKHGIFITGDEGNDLWIFALASGGRITWRARNGRAWTGQYPGARSSCTLAGDRLFHMNAHGRLACLDAVSGKELWAVNALERFDAANIRWGLSESVLVDGDRVVVTPGGRKAAMAALDVRTGETVWASEPLPGGQAGYSSPVLFHWQGMRHLVAFASHVVFGVNADTGNLLWSHPKTTAYDENVMVPVFHNGCVYVSNPHGRRGVMLKLEVDGDDVRARELWTCAMDNCHSGVVLVDGFLYGAGHLNVRGWTCVDAATGREMYDSRALTRGSAVFAEGRLYCLTERGVMALVRASPQEFDVVSSFRFVEAGGDVWAHPVICRRRLYLRYHASLSCYDIAADRTETSADRQCSATIRRRSKASSKGAP